MKELIYTSTAVDPMGTLELAQIISSSRQFNAINNITGVLLYNTNGTFIQILEGEKKRIDLLYQNIRKDTRHESVLLVHEANIAQRAFPTWSMGCKLFSDESDEHSKRLYKTLFTQQHNSNENPHNIIKSIVDYVTEKGCH